MPEKSEIVPKKQVAKLQMAKKYAKVHKSVKKAGFYNIGATIRTRRESQFLLHTEFSTSYQARAFNPTLNGNAHISATFPPRQSVNVWPWVCAAALECGQTQARLEVATGLSVIQCLARCIRVGYWNRAEESK